MEKRKKKKKPLSNHLRVNQNILHEKKSENIFATIKRLHLVADLWPPEGTHFQKLQIKFHNLPILCQMLQESNLILIKNNLCKIWSSALLKECITYMLKIEKRLT
ncbi:hypothetical protein ACH5RR_014774 [Cinchona calisaya]|uniref:Uncharacterized protein n=1 Tax=Cinchona calisaya TaxID=153742 RepID=A0ABD2ZUS2_9GENT